MVPLYRRRLGWTRRQPRQAARHLGRGAVDALPGTARRHDLSGTASSQALWLQLLRARPGCPIPDGICHDVLGRVLAGQPSALGPEGLLPDARARAFYVIDRQFILAIPNPSTKCTVALDPKAFQFFCPGTDLRWNRVGQPLGAHAGGGPDWALPLQVATVAQDGHVLFSPFFRGDLRFDLKGSPWG